MNNGQSHPPADNRTILSGFAESLGLPSLEDLDRYPKFVEIETTSSCNARCVMCPVGEMGRNGKLMPQEIFDKIVGDLAGHTDWLERVALPVIGEPLVDKKLESRVAILKGIGVKFIHLTCNASLMTRKRAEALIRAGLDCIDFSIDGATRETFEAIRKPLNFDTCVANILTFIEARDRLNSKLNIRVRMTLLESNRHEFDRFLSFWRRHLEPHDLAYGKLAHRWASGWSDFQPVQETSEETLNATACVLPWGTMSIFSDGRVPFCGSDFNADITLGDIIESSIREIWQSATARRIRQAHLRRGRNGLDKCVGCVAFDPAAKLTSAGSRWPTSVWV